MTDLPIPVSFTREDWQADAACRGLTDLFFSDQGVGAYQAKAICHGQCPVRDECLQYALRLNIGFGVFGGLSPKERRLMPKPKRILPVGPVNDPRCGTTAGHRVHIRAGEPPCTGCREAYNRYKAGWKTTRRERVVGNVVDYGRGGAA